jgi:zinc protease
MVDATLTEEASFDAIVRALQEELDRLAAGEVDPERVEAVKSHVRYALLSSMQTPSDVADTAASFIAVGGDLGALDGYLEALAAVTPEDVARVAREYLNEDRRFVVTLAHGPAEGETEGEAEGAGEESE